MGSSEIDRSQRYMTCNKLGSRFGGTKSRTALVSFPCIERPSPEGAGASGDPHGAAPRASDFPSVGCLVGPSGRTLSGFKLSLESITACSGYNSIKSSGVKGKTPPIPDTGLLCEECVVRVDVLREKARRLLNEGHFSTNDPKLSVLLCENVRVPADRCNVCSTHLSQLKQEAVRTLLPRERAIWPGPLPANVAPGSPASGAHTLPRACGLRFPDTRPRQSPRSPDKHCWVTQPTHLHTLWPLSGNNRVSSFNHTTSHDALKKKKDDDEATSAAPVLCQFGGPLHFNASKVSTMLPAGTSAAVSFIVRAVQKLNLTSRRRKQRSDNESYPTNFSGLLHKTPPPMPSNLLHTAGKGREMAETGKVKVMLRVSPSPRAEPSRSQALKLDLRRRQVIVLEPATPSRQGRLFEGTVVTPKAFTFDAAFGPESSQAEVCERSLLEVLQSVVAGSDGCILSFGQTKEGMSYTMIGRDDCASRAGVIPCAISWLFKLLNKKTARTWANISVSVSAVEVCGETEVIRDLLSDIESGNHKDTHKSNVCLQEDPICGIKVFNSSVLSAPTAERAAFLLDAALVSRRTGVAGTSLHNCYMFYTLHVCQKHIECSSKSGMYVDQSKLSLIDLGSCTKESTKNNTAVCLVDLGNVIMAKLSGHNHLHNKGSKLEMLMQECLGNVNCCTTIIAHISTSPEDISETLCTIQIVSQIRRLQRKTRKSACSSPGGRSLGRSKDRKVNMSPKNRLRTFRSAGTLNREFSLPSLFDDPDERSVSDKSCDALVCLEPNGYVNLDQEVKRSQEFLPIIPSLQRTKAGLKVSSSTKHCDILWPASQSPHAPKMEAKMETTQQKSLGCGIPDLECLKCNTFAELQNRLVCIDGTDVGDMSSCMDQSANTVIISEPLSGKPTKIHTEQPEVQGYPRKKDVNDKELGCPIQRENPVNNNREMPYRYTSQTKVVKKIFNCSSRLDNVNSSIESEQSTGSPNGTETMQLAPSLPPPMEQLSSEDSISTPKVRTSPLGKSSSTLSASLGTPASYPLTLNEVPIETQKVMKATITVTVQQPLDLNGHDEVVYSVVEEVTINGADNKGKHAKTASITDPNYSKRLPSESHPVMIISSVGGEQGEGDSESQLQTPVVLSGGKASSAASNSVVKSQIDNTFQPDNSLDESQNEVKDVSEGATTQCEVLNFTDHSFEIGPEQNATKKKCNQSNRQNSKESNGSFSPVNQKMLSDVYRMETQKDQVSSYVAHGTSSPTRVWLSPENQDDSFPISMKRDREPKCGSPRTTLERKMCPVKHGFMEWAEEREPTSPVQKPEKSIHNKRNRKTFMTPCLELDRPIPDNKLDKTPKSPVEESSKLFSAKLEQLANRSRSQGRSRLECFEFRFDEQSTSVCCQDYSGRLVGDCTLPRVTKRHLEQGHCIALGPKGNLEGSYAPFQAKGMTQLAERTAFEEDLSQASLKRVPRSCPMHDVEDSDTSKPSKLSQYKMPNDNKMLFSSKMSGTIPKNSSVSSKSTRHSINRSSSLSPDGFSVKKISWSSQSLSRKQGKASISSKNPGRAPNGRVELLRAGGNSLCSSSLSSLDIDDPEESNVKMKLLTRPLPSPYSRITAPRKPSHCSGNASDNTSVLSGELPPAMCKTALLYHRNSTVSSGYESMMRDSEAMCSSTSTHDSSDQNVFFSSPRTSKKRNSAASRQRHSSQDTLLSDRRSASGSKIRWVDRGTSESYEIKVYEIDSVAGFKKRAEAGNKLARVSTSCEGDDELERQAKIPGAPTTEDCGVEGQVQQPKERAEASQAASEDEPTDTDPGL
ncbi:kinesin-like protein KIF26B isoform X2 [Brachyhypopomus gauderio]|uniref:kinesin-like protein KIF26B isoform X2 n=1 Tax=Brachyhypopomus gauderio TaxID=698409 RepID=UPI0040413A84